MPSNMYKMGEFTSSCTCGKYQPGLFFPFIVHSSVVSTDSVSGQWRPWSDCADAQADLGLRSPHMPDDPFSHCAANIRKEPLCQAKSEVLQSACTSAQSAQRVLFLSMYLYSKESRDSAGGHWSDRTNVTRPLFSWESSFCNFVLC